MFLWSIQKSQILVDLVGFFADVCLNRPRIVRAIVELPDDAQEARVVELLARFLRQLLVFRRQVDDRVDRVYLQVDVAEDHLALLVYLNLTVLALEAVMEGAALEVLVDGGRNVLTCIEAHFYLVLRVL